ncbi:MAG: hypothetical protein AAF655_08280 [Bacteroidota bacterium]
MLKTVVIMNLWRMSMLLLLFLGISGYAIAQNYISLHTDKSFYVVGERIWFSAYLTSESGKPISSGDLSISLFHESGEELLTALFPIKDGQVAGDVYLEESLPVGNYLFSMSSLAIKPNEMYAQHVILPVLHPSLMETLQLPESVWPSLLVQELPTETPNVTVDMGVESLSPRKMINVSLGSPQLKGRKVSVAIRHLNQTGLSEIQQLAGTFTPTSSSYPYSPDSWNLQAGLTKAGGGILPDMVNVYWAEQDTQMLSKVTDGSFSLSLPKRSGVQHFQVLDASPFPDHNFQVAWEQQGKERISLPPIPPMGELSEEQKSYLYWFQRRKLVERLFQFNLVSPAEEEGTTLVRPKADKSYSSQKYLAFKDLEAFIREVLSPAVKVVSTGRQKTIRMLNFDSRVRFTQPPLVFLDGYLMEDVSQVWEVNWNNVDRLELFGSHETIFPYFGPMGQGRGVIRLFTKGRQNFEGKISYLPISSLEAYSPPHTFQLPNNELAKPDLRPVLFWDGSLLMDKEGQAEISFPHSDLKGQFLIEVKGLQEDGTFFTAFYPYELD